jgi:hypothetical protein
MVMVFPCGHQAPEPFSDTRPSMPCSGADGVHPDGVGIAGATTVEDVSDCGPSGVGTTAAVGTGTDEFPPPEACCPGTAQDVHRSRATRIRVRRIAC